ncbi:hypothetical protein [Anaerorhabdus sp.]|uniref:hypothetical protein n=1 Tax=Anaerorhabdus sp. TaxID=1872524 RepID=UPI002FCC2808
MELFKLFGTIIVKNEDALSSMQKTEDKANGVSKKFLDMIGSSGQMGSSIQQGFDGITSKAGEFGLKLDANALAVGGLAIAAVAAFAAIGSAIMDSVNKFADYAGAVDDYAQKIGVSTETYQKFGYAMRQSGLDINVMQTGMKKLLDTVVSADEGNKKSIETFDKLGLSIYDSNGYLKDNDTLMKETILALAEMPVGAERAALANDLLGKSATELAPLFNQGADGINNLMDRAEELGLVFSNDAIAAGATFGDTMYDINASFDAVAMEMGATFMPMMQGFLNWVLENMPMIRSVSEKVFGGIGFAIKLLTPGFQLLGTLVGWVFNVFDLAFNGIEAIVTPIAKGIINVLNGLIDVINTLSFGLLNLQKIDVSGKQINASKREFKVSQNDDGTTTEYSPYYQSDDMNYYANGGSLQDGQTAIVGEYGRELLQNVGGKSIVKPLTNQTSTNGDTIYINVDAKNIKELNDLIRIAKQAKQRNRMGTI